MTLQIVLGRQPHVTYTAPIRFDAKMGPVDMVLQMLFLPKSLIARITFVRAFLQVCMNPRSNRIIFAHRDRKECQDINVRFLPLN